MIPKEMIEAAALAEYDLDYPPVYGRAPWSDLPETVKAWRRDRAKAALAAALSPELLSKGQWRGMESAPKDGTMILAVFPWLPYAKVIFWATYANEWRCPATEELPCSIGPTHWMPLPPPPPEKASGIE